jgi:hypothetical protein
MARVREYRGESAGHREDADRAERDGLLEQARNDWHRASCINLWALKHAESYDRIDALRGEGKNWIVRKGTIISDNERTFVRTYYDTLGRQGGLYRRLGCLKSAENYYQMGQMIEQV